MFPPDQTPIATPLPAGKIFLPPIIIITDISSEKDPMMVEKFKSSPETPTPTPQPHHGNKGLMIIILVLVLFILILLISNMCRSTPTTAMN